MLLAGISFASGYWAVLLALGPAAYLLVLDAHNSDNAPQMVVIRYIATLATGWATYSVVARGIVPMTVEPIGAWTPYRRKRSDRVRDHNCDTLRVGDVPTRGVRRSFHGRSRGIRDSPVAGRCRGRNNDAGSHSGRSPSIRSRVCHSVRVSRRAVVWILTPVTVLSNPLLELPRADWDWSVQFFARLELYRM